MKFQPKTDEQIQKEAQARMLWPNGAYSFEILEEVTFGTKTIRTCESKSEKGNDMLVLVVKLFNDDGRETVVIDYITEAMSFKLKHLAYAVGLGSQYDAGEIDAFSLIGKCGKAQVTASKGKPKNDSSGQNYPDKNAIADYLVEDSAAANVPGQIATPTPVHDDTIPF